MNKTFDNQRFVSMRKTIGLSQKGLGDAIGMKQGSISDIERGKVTDLSNQTKKFLSDNYNINIDYLYNESNNLFINKEDFNQAVVSYKAKKGRPFYDVDFTLGFEQLDNDVELHPEFNIDFAPANKDTITWFRGKGNSMLGEINSGDYIALEEITNFDWFPLGRVYGIITKNGFRTIKRIVKSELQDHYLLSASNPDKTSHPDQDIPKEMISKLFKVMYVIKDLDE